MMIATVEETMRVGDETYTQRYEERFGDACREDFRAIFNNLFLYKLCNRHGLNSTLERVLLDEGLLDEFNSEYKEEVI